MGNPFKSSPTVVQVPSSSNVTGSGEVKPYKEVEPYLKNYLPTLEQIFTEEPALYTGALTPGQSEATQLALQGYGDVAAGLSGYGQMGQQALQQRKQTAFGSLTDDPVYRARTQVLADEARRMTERDKATLQQQAMQAGQYSLGSTAMQDLAGLQQQRREELTRSGLSQALSEAEKRQTAALTGLPQFASQAAQMQMLPSQIQETIGKAQEAYTQAGYADAARLAQQQQEAQRKQAINFANILGSLAGLGTSTTYQSASQGMQGQAFAQPSVATQVAQLGGLLLGR